ncbi:hypothetical protein BP5796_06611 [Coleophoma crateriformis]|uniref:Bromo domain-containing protein n=1 Tax=Coleophoma crateriformis TaxID=565419 RepID=A0A3D8RPA6_9HELO|nr:hypothetical protein BP5796_06611 [Coleophoma crateriformis]
MVPLEQLTGPRYAVNRCRRSPPEPAVGNEILDKGFSVMSYPYRDSFCNPFHVPTAERPQTTTRLRSRHVQTSRHVTLQIFPPRQNIILIHDPLDSHQPPHVIVVAPLHLFQRRDSPLDSWRGGYWGMNTTTAYTALECLLLFQSLVAYGTEPESFLRISGLLRSNSLVKDADTYDPARLTVNALQDLYEQLLRDELKADADLVDGQDAGQAASKKRKLQSPKLKDVPDKLPYLVERLYARYRDYMVKAICEDEKRYATIQQEIGEIERGEWDDRILQENGALLSKKGSLPTGGPKPEPVNGTSTNDGTEKTIEEKKQETDVPSPPTEPNGDAPGPANGQSPIPSPRPGSQGLATNEVLNSQNASIAAPPKTEARDSSSRGRKPSQNIPPTPLMSTPRPSSNGPNRPSSNQAGNQQQGAALQWEPPYQATPLQPPQFQSAGNYPQFNPPHCPPQAYPPPQRGSFSGPHNLPPHFPHVPSSPVNGSHPPHVLLPPPNSALMSPGSPAMPLDQLADIAGQQQYRAPSRSPIQQQQGPISHPQGPHLPQAPYNQPYPPQQHPQPHPQQQWDPRSPGSNAPNPQWNQQYMPQYPGTPQQSHFPQQYPQPPAQFAHRPDLIAPENRQYNSPYNASQPSKPHAPFPSQNSSTPRQRPSLPNTPINQVRSQFITGSGTRWTPVPTASTPRREKAVRAPSVEPLSPKNSPKLQNATLAKKPRKQVQKSNLKKSPAASQTPVLVPTPKDPKEAKTSAPRRGGQRTRAGSTASSVVAGSYRSQSVMSHADELSMDNEVLPSRKVKQEVATPRPLDDLGDTTADEGPSRPRRNLRDIPSPRPNTKRKRVESTETHETPGPPTQVLWTRAFPKISASAIEAITSHRNASTFAAPVKNRDAPGYTRVIYRPQDLKSVKSAIIAGAKAAAAVAPDDSNQSSSIWLPISEDLVPPKGIINYAQLEKEMMRIFANAIMFSYDPNRGIPDCFHQESEAADVDTSTYKIDENSVVKDTRAMFLDVEKTIGDLRSAERRSEEKMESVERDDEVDELANDAATSNGDIYGSVAKRRRKN